MGRTTLPSCCSWRVSACCSSVRKAIAWARTLMNRRSARIDSIRFFVNFSRASVVTTSSMRRADWLATRTAICCSDDFERRLTLPTGRLTSRGDCSGVLTCSACFGTHATIELLLDLLDHVSGRLGQLIERAYWQQGGQIAQSALCLRQRNEALRRAP